jgi:hypothetical protein
MEHFTETSLNRMSPTSGCVVGLGETVRWVALALGTLHQNGQCCIGQCCIETNLMTVLPVTIIKLRLPKQGFFLCFFSLNHEARYRSYMFFQKNS